MCERALHVKGMSKEKASGDVRDELQGAPSLTSPAAVVLPSGFSSSTVAVSAVFSLGSMKRSLGAFYGRVGLFP